MTNKMYSPIVTNSVSSPGNFATNQQATSTPLNKHNGGTNHQQTFMTSSQQVPQPQSYLRNNQQPNLLPQQPNLLPKQPNLLPQQPSLLPQNTLLQGLHATTTTTQSQHNPPLPSIPEVPLRGGGAGGQPPTSQLQNPLGGMISSTPGGIYSSSTATSSTPLSRNYASLQQNQQAVIMSPPAYNTNLSEQSKLTGASSLTTASPALSTTPVMAFQNQQAIPGSKSVSESGKEWSIKVLIRSKDGEKRQVLNIFLQEKLNPTDHSKEIYIQVTDKHDPMLFYSLCIAEEDFQNLKASQGLLVDFTTFPGMLAQLLDKCEQEGDNSSPAFILIFNLSPDSTCTLEFTELNLFKHLCHLSLMIMKATDTKLKEYLVSCIQQLKTDLHQTSCQLSVSQQQLNDRQEQLSQHMKQLEAVKREQQETSSSLGQKMISEVQQEKENCTAKLNEMQSRFEVERRELDARHARSIDQLENRVASLDVQNRDLLEGKYRNESNIRELRGKLAAKDDELKRLEADFHSLSRDKGLTDVRNRDEARRVTDLQKQVDNLEAEARANDLEMQKMREMVRLANKEKDDLVADVKEKTSTVSRRETAVRNVTDELLKANEIIGKLQDQLKQEQNKSKLRGKIATEQEKLLSDKDKDLQAVQEQLRKTEVSKDEILKEQEEHLAKVGELESEKEKLEQLNKSNENVINWLNKQLASFKTTESNIGITKANTAGSARGRGKPIVTRKSTSDVNTESSKENEPFVGLDPKYFQVSTPGGSVTRNEIPDVRQLPTNIKRTGGFLRR